MSWLTSTWSLGPAIGAFAVATATIAYFGSKLAGIVDRLADRTGMGEAIAGAVLLAGANSIAGMIVSGVAAASGDASLAVSNSVGGIAAQTAFIAIADLVYRGVNLEHAAASVINIFNSLLMMVLLSIILLGAVVPPVTFLAVHPATPVLLGAYAYGLHLSRRIKDAPMWKPEETSLTRVDEPEETSFQGSMTKLWVSFFVFGGLVSVAGFAVGRAGISIIEQTGLTGTVVAVFFTSVVTSLPELVTAVAAVRAGALTLAVGGIVGGNTFDVLFVAVADVAYREGSIYGAIDRVDIFVIGWTMVLIGVVAAGLVRREREGIGFEGYGVLVLYLLGLLTVWVMS